MDSGRFRCQKSHTTLPTTFITPLGRYAFNKLPFGISSAPEYFQRRMNQILAGQEGALCHMDGVLIFGHTQQEHDSRLNAALTKILAAGLNTDKCEFNKTKINFLGHVINRNGISPNPQKTEAVLSMDKPCSQTELRRFMGMTNQLSKFSSKIAELSQPLQTLLDSKHTWLWGPAQDELFEAIKAELAHSTTYCTIVLHSLPTQFVQTSSNSTRKDGHKTNAKCLRSYNRIGQYEES